MPVDPAMWMTPFVPGFWPRKMGNRCAASARFAPGGGAASRGSTTPGHRIQLPARAVRRERGYALAAALGGKADVLTEHEVRVAAEEAPRARPLHDADPPEVRVVVRRGCGRPQYRLPDSNRSW